MQMIPVNSSAISAVGYNALSKTMRIKFKASGFYDFHGVPEHIFNGLLNARSKGGYYNAYIRGQYQ